MDFNIPTHIALADSVKNIINCLEIIEDTLPPDHQKELRHELEKAKNNIKHAFIFEHIKNLMIERGEE